ncbi:MULTISPECIES: MarR family winged helix-turn-helix transcriptional regulator [unclassified Streptomyces]|uniref:MarR family winged helix-turn-helix transcriptional regulator n=1 Tax=unclassified Streptomyces TaxID=2593676 RepID=UPI002E163A3A|nr:MarR family winged helix-turn-helix transcriptional regulator [Streptomyces sp. NBC_01197]WSS49260.1 MarR family winged helix-turn-helix transcriptional regulator [Streptomyces sp. NBC_01180]
MAEKAAKNTAGNTAAHGALSGDRASRPDRRPDLAAMVVPLGRAMMAAEQPILDAHGLTMWAYAVLLRLDEEPIRTQSALAEAIGADKTRIIGVLDGLETRGLIRRRPDPHDRRARLLSLTAEGQRLRDATQSAIQRREEEFLLLLPTADRHAFVRALQTLSAPPALSELTPKKP